jgi:hypothetical protein
VAIVFPNLANVGNFMKSSVGPADDFPFVIAIRHDLMIRFADRPPQVLPTIGLIRRVALGREHIRWRLPAAHQNIFGHEWCGRVSAQTEGTVRTGLPNHPAPSVVEM